MHPSHHVDQRVMQAALKPVRHCFWAWLGLILLVLGPATAAAQPDDDQDLDDEEGPVATAQKRASGETSRDEDPGIYAPTISGLTGLFRIVTGDIGSRNTFRVGLHTEAFKSSDFLVQGDSNSRFIGTLAGSYTPWEYLELFLNIRSTANNNDRASEDDRLDQPLILALGDLSFGAKGQYPIIPALSVGMNFGLTLLNSVGGLSFDGDSTSFYIGMLTSFNLDPLANFPLRFHMNLGYQIDNSNALASLENYPLSSLVVEKFALGINPSRMQFKFGFDVPLRRYIGFGLTPIIELATDFSTAEADPDFDVKRFGKPAGTLSPEDFDGKTTMWMTFGVRATPVKGFNVELAFDKGVVSPGFSYGPPVVPWNLIFGLSYAYDPAPPTKVVTREKVKTVVKEVASKPPSGRLRGRVINEQTMEPVEGAVVTLPGKDLTGLSTDPDGSFLSYDLPEGKHPFMIRHPDYQPAKLMVAIKVGGITAHDIKLVPAAPKLGKIVGEITDPKGKPIPATIGISGPESKQVTADDSGRFSVEVKPGSYTLSTMAEGYLRKEQLASVVAGAELTANFSLSPKPKRPLVRVTKHAIVISRQVHFGTGTANIMPDSQQLLDSIVDTLLSNPNIKKIEIAGHTDNRGSASLNEKLSQSRAESVQEYLTKNGVSTDRLVAKGYGPHKPKVPNITARNRARNRRVEFLILEQ